MHERARKRFTGARAGAFLRLRTVRVVLDVSAIPDQPVGAGMYVINLARALDAGAEVQLELLARRGDRRRWRDIAPGAKVHDKVPSPRPARLLWEQVMAPRLAASLAADVWHGPHYTLPLRVAGPAVVTIPDMTFFEYPQYHERSKVVFFQRMMRAASTRADVIVAISEATAEKVGRILRPPHPVVVAPLGVDRSRFRASGDDGSDDLRALAASGVRPPFLVFVGTLEPRKNVPGLVAAFSRLASRHPMLQLVIAGRPGWGARDVQHAIERSPYRSRIRALGYTEPELVPALYRQAAVVVYPSHDEGFGLPALEALACAAPLVTSSGTPMEQVAGDAAVLARPGRDDELAAAVERVLTDEELARRLREAGPRVAGRYSWGLCARAHIDAYRLAVEGAG